MCEPKSSPPKHYTPPPKSKTIELKNIAAISLIVTSAGMLLYGVLSKEPSKTPAPDTKKCDTHIVVNVPKPVLTYPKK